MGLKCLHFGSNRSVVAKVLGLMPITKSKIEDYYEFPVLELQVYNCTINTYCDDSINWSR